LDFAVGEDLLVAHHAVFDEALPDNPGNVFSRVAMYPCVINQAGTESALQFVPVASGAMLLVELDDRARANAVLGHRHYWCNE
jgi:hypothetical protein